MREPEQIVRMSKLKKGKVIMKTLPINHGGPRGIAPIPFKKKMKSMKEVMLGKQVLNETLNFDLIKPGRCWFVRVTTK